MPDIDTRELSKDVIIPEAVFRRTAPGTSPSHIDAVRKINSQEEKKVEQTFDNRVTVTTDQVPHLDEMKATIEHKIDGSKNTGTLVRNVEQTRRLNQANDAAELAFHVLDKGYEHLTRGQKRQLQERVLPAMMRLWPSLNEAFGTMNRRERQQAMEDILQDPGFHQELNRIVAEILQEDTGSVEKTSYEQKREEHEKKLLEKQRVDRDYTEAVGKAAEFATGGAKAAELGRLPTKGALEAAMARVDREIRLLQTELVQVNIEIGVHEKNANLSGTPDKDARAATAATQLPILYGRRNTINQTELPRKEQDKADIETQKKRREELDAEKEKYEGKESELLSRKEELDREVGKLQRDMLSAQADVGISRHDKAAKEKAFVTALQSSFARAAEVVVRKRAESAEVARGELQKKIPGEAREIALRDRYLDQDGKLKKDVIKTDYRRLIHNEFDDVVVDMLVQGGMRHAEAVEKIDNDKDFAQALRTDAATELMARYLQAGNKMKPEEVRRLMKSEIGIDVVSKALDANEQSKQELENFMKRMNPEDKEKVKKEGWSAVLKKIKLPKITGKQLLTATAISGGVLAGGFFAGPTILGWLIPQIYSAADRWVGLAHKYPVFQPAVDAVATAQDQVQQAVTQSVIPPTSGASLPIKPS